MTTHPTDEELAARIRAACGAQADRLVVDARPLELDRAAGLAAPAAATAPRRGRWLAVAAVVALLAGVAATAVALRPDDPSQDVVAGSTTTAPPVPTGPTWLAPSAPPLGLELQSVAWRQQPEATGRRAQLFEAPGGGRVLVLVQPSDVGGQGAGEAVVVRGAPGQAAPSKEDGDRSTTITWFEGASLEARFIGMGQAEAVALLDALEWRSTDPIDGYARPAAGAARLVAEAAPQVTTQNAELTYADAPTSVGPGEGTQVQIHTVVADAPTIAELEARYLADEAITDPEAVSSYDDEFGTLTITWADGGSAWVDANKTGVAAGELRRIADSLVPTTEAQLLELRDGEGPTAPTADATTTTTTTTSATTTSATPTTATSTTLPEFPEDLTFLALPRIGGSATTTIDELADGRPAIVVIGASWCVPCAEAASSLQAHADRDHVAIIGVALDLEPSDAQAWIDELGLTYPWLHDPGAGTVEVLGGAEVPVTVLLRADGSLEAVITGDRPTEDPRIAQLLAG